MTLSNNYDVYIGLDVDKNSYVFTVYDEVMKKSRKIPANPGHLFNYVKNNYPGKRILFAYEAGPTGYNCMIF